MCSVEFGTKLNWPLHYVPGIGYAPDIYNGGAKSNKSLSQFWACLPIKINDFNNF